jgi:hypothetical protein
MSDNKCARCVAWTPVYPCMPVLRAVTVSRMLHVPFCSFLTRVLAQKLEGVLVKLGRRRLDSEKLQKQSEELSQLADQIEAARQARGSCGPSSRPVAPGITRERERVASRWCCECTHALVPARDTHSGTTFILAHRHLALTLWSRVSLRASMASPLDLWRAESQGRRAARPGGREEAVDDPRRLLRCAATAKVLARTLQLEVRRWLGALNARAAGALLS